MNKKTKLTCLFAVICVIGALGLTGAFTSALDKELQYYEREGHPIIDTETYEEYKISLSESIFETVEIKVTAKELRDEVLRTMDLFGCAEADIEIYVDSEARILWFWGEAPVGEAHNKVYLYFFKAK